MSVTRNALTEARGAIQLGGEAFDQLTRRVEEFHRAISDMPFNAIPPVPGLAPGKGAVQTAHDEITTGVYSLVRGIGGALFKTAETALKTVERNYQPPASQSAPALARDNLVSAVSGFVGDAMAHERNPLAVKLGCTSLRSRVWSGGSSVSRLRRSARDTRVSSAVAAASAIAARCSGVISLVWSTVKRLSSIASTPSS